MFVRVCAVFQSTHRSREWNLYLKCVFCDLVIISIVIIIHPGTVAYTLHAIAWWALRCWIKPKPGVILYLLGTHGAVCPWREEKAALLTLREGVGPDVNMTQAPQGSGPFK